MWIFDDDAKSEDDPMGFGSFVVVKNGDGRVEGAFDSHVEADRGKGAKWGKYDVVYNLSDEAPTEGFTERGGALDGWHWF